MKENLEQNEEDLMTWNTRGTQDLLIYIITKCLLLNYERIHFHSLLEDLNYLLRGRI